MQVHIVSFLVLCACVHIKCSNESEEPLNLSPLVESGELKKARNLSAVDPSLFAGLQSHAGYFTVNKTGKYNLFFWYFPAENGTLDTTPLVIWLQGGPGSSSLYGLFKAIGPIRINNHGKAERMPISWASSYSLLFIDNPVGAGFSYSDLNEYVSNQDMVGACLLNFLQQFLDVFPELRKAPLFIAGESYAGKYIPAFGHYIHDNKNKLKPINLKGLSIGSGWIDPPTMLHYSEWALQVGLVDNEQAAKLKAVEDKAMVYWEQKNYEAFANEASIVVALLMAFAPGDYHNYANDSDDNETDVDNYLVFLRRYDVQKALHVGYRNFTQLSYSVHRHLSGDFYMTVKPWLEEMVEHYGVMCYNGQFDLLVAYALSAHTYRSLNWSGQLEYLSADRIPIFDTINDIRVNSFLKTSGNFMDVMVRGAGHTVAADQPRAVKQIIDMFIRKFK